MLKVKRQYIHQKPPHCNIILGEFTEKQLDQLPEYLKNEYCETIKKKKIKYNELGD
tara:strand:- start:446 stop:613 length:168 start_codon:yes stop_codon:yes gene_type:complete